CPCGDLLHGQIVLQEKLLGVVQTLLYEVGVGRDLEFLAEQLPEILISKSQILSRAPAAVVRDLSASQEVSCLVQETAHRGVETLRPVHVIDAEDELLSLQKQVGKLLRGGVLQVVVEQKAPVQKGLVKTRAEDRLVLEEPHVGEGPVGLIPK